MDTETREVLDDFRQHVDRRFVAVEQKVEVVRHEMRESEERLRQHVDVAVEQRTRESEERLRQHVNVTVDRKIRDSEERLRQHVDVAVDRKIRDSEERLRQHVDVAVEQRTRESEERLRQHFDVAVEAFRSEFRVFGEGLHGVTRRVEALEEGHAKTHAREEKLEVRVLALERRRPPRRRG